MATKQQVKTKKQYTVFESADTRLAYWADLCPDLDKSGVMRIVLELGMYEFERSGAVAQLPNGAAAVLSAAMHRLKQAA